jgi:hypothetical protein
MSLATPIEGTLWRSRYATLSARAAWALPLVVAALWLSSFVVGWTTALASLLLLSAAVTLAGFRNPPWGLVGISMLATLDSVARVFIYTGGILRWNTLAYWLLLVVPVFWRDLRRAWGWILTLGALFIGLMAVEIIGSPAPDRGLEHVLGASVLFGMAAYAVRGTRALAWGLAARVCGVLAAVGTPIFLLVRRDLDYLNPNSWSYLPLTALFVAAIAAAARTERRHADPVLSLLVAANLCWVFLSGSRGSLLVAGIVVAAYLWLVRRHGIWRWAVALALLVPVLLAGPFHELQEDTALRLEKLFDDERSLSNRTSGRSDIAFVGWRMFLDHPAGVGTGGFMSMAGRYGAVFRLDIFRGHEELQAHSAWIKTLGENGFPGILLMVAFVLSFAVVGWRSRRRGLLALGLATTASLAVAFLTSEFQARGLWLLSAGALVLLRFDQPGAARQVPAPPAPTDARSPAA